MKTMEYLDKLEHKIAIKQGELKAMAELLEGSKLKLESDLIYQRIDMLEKFWKHINFITNYKKMNLEEGHADRVFDDLPLI